jgi:AcrR family transcriptional regulator
MTAPTKNCPGRPPDEALQRRRREEILDRAGKIFAEHGYPGTDVQWIAQAVGVSKGTVYRYFATKQELFLAAVDRGVARMYEHIERAKQGVDDPFDLIRAAVHAYLQFFKKNPELVELFIQERAEFKGKRKSSYFQHRDARRGPWREMVRSLIAQGRIRSMPVERVIDVLGDVLYGTMFTNHFAGRDKPFDAQAEDILDVLFKGIMART